MGSSVVERIGVKHMQCNAMQCSIKNLQIKLGGCLPFTDMLAPTEMKFDLILMLCLQNMGPIPGTTGLNMKHFCGAPTCTHPPVPHQWPTHGEPRVLGDMSKVPIVVGDVGTNHMLEANFRQFGHGVGGLCTALLYSLWLGMGNFMSMRQL